MIKPQDEYDASRVNFMVERIDIERALDDIVSNEEGMRFQGLAVVLAKLRWPELIACERHKDHGLDAYASSILCGDGKGRGLASSTTATLTKIAKDAQAAKDHYEDLAILLFATPAKVTRQTWEPWQKEIRDRYGLELHVMSREDIIATLQLPDNVGICRSHLRLAIPYEQPVADIVRQVGEAAATVIASAAQRLAGRPYVASNVVMLGEGGEETAERFSVTDLPTMLLQGRRIVLEGPAGRGKTTMLVRIAQASAETDGIPIFVDLPAWVRSRSDILDFVAQHPAFRARGIRADDLARLTSANQYLFLLNGWNEVSATYADDALTALASIERAFPTAGIVVATRAHHIHPPLPGALRLRLLPLTARQRAEYVRAALPDGQARDLEATLAGDRVLDEVTRTPLILAEITNLFAAGREIPRTTFGVLRAVVRMNEETEHHRGPLAAYPLAGRAGDYLRAVAMTLTARGDVLLSDAEARAVCSGASERLRVSGQIAALPEPSLVLASLASHHVLERVDYPDASFRFEHQQFQEYFAAAALRDALDAIAETNDPAQRTAFVRLHLNVPAWQEPLEMLADDLGDSDRDVTVGHILVGDTLALDPVFAARLARLSGPRAWSEVRGAVHERLRSLYTSADPYHQRLALAAMLATGSDEFADVIVPRLTSTDQQVRHATYRAGPDLYPVCVGTEWQTVVAAWPEQQRIEFLSHLTLDGEHLDVAYAFARTDASASVRIEAIRLLLWMRQNDVAAEILRSLPDPEFASTIERAELAELPPDLRTRALTMYATTLAGEDDPKVRYHLALTLAEQGDPDGPTRLKQELTTLPAELVRELSNYSLRRAVEAVRCADVSWVNEWIARWIADGALWHEAWLPFVSAIPAALTDELFRRAVTDETVHGGVVEVLAATADAPLAERAFAALRDQRRVLHTNPRSEREQTLERRLRSLLRTVPAPLLIDGLSTMLAADPRDEDVDVLLSIFGELQRPDAADDPLPEASRQQLRRYLKLAVPTILAREDFRGEAKAHLAAALAEVGIAEDVDDLVALHRADIERVRVGRDLRLRGERSPRSDGASMRYAFSHVQALLRLDSARAEPILCGLLEESEYELDAVWALRELAKREPSKHRTIEGRFGGPRPDYRAVHRTPRDWARLFDPARRERYAHAIRERIAHILEDARRVPDTARSNHWRAKELVKPLAALDPFESADLILDVAAIPFDVDGWVAVGLLEALVFGGVTLSADRVLPMIEAAVERLRRHGTYNDNAGLVQRLACILPFIDPSARGVARARELLAEFRLAAHEQRDVVTALGQCPDEDGLVLLCEIARWSGDQFQYIAREWLTAVATSPHSRAKHLLLSFIDGDVPDGMGDFALPEDALSILAGILANLATSDTAIAARLFELCASVRLAHARVVLAKVCALLGTTEALYAGLNLLDDGAVPSIPYDVLEAAEEVFLEKRPSQQIANAYRLVPRAASDVRARLFDMATHDARRSRSARELMERIESWRLEHGRPPFEPRHPGYETNIRTQ